MIIALTLTPLHLQDAYIRGQSLMLMALLLIGAGQSLAAGTSSQRRDDMNIKLPPKCCDNPQRFVVAPVIGFECRNCGHRECRNGNEELLNEMAEALHKLLTKVARYGYDFQLETEFDEGKVIMQKYYEQVG